MMRLSANEKLATLGRCRVFASLPAANLGLLAEMMRAVETPAGTTVCETGETARELYVIHEGELDVTVPGDDAPVRTMRAGEIFGELGMFGKQVRTSTVVARTPAVLLMLEYGRFRSLLLAYPEACLALLEVTVERLVFGRAEARGAARDSKG